jgi:exosome complex exonuclease RRP6
MRSTLFGNIKDVRVDTPADRAQTQEGDSGVSGSSRFQELVKRINSTLVIAPTVPKVNNPPSPLFLKFLVAATTTSASVTTIGKEATTAATAAATETTDAFEDATGMQIEIPFVPASQRRSSTIKAEEKEKDTIVIIGQSKTKKRKRTKSTLRGKEAKQESPGGSEGKEEKAGAEGEGGEAPFDFASVPNILDDNPDVESGKPARKKQKKGKGKGKGACCSSMSSKYCVFANR